MKEDFFNIALSSYLEDLRKNDNGLSFIGMSTKFENQFVSNFATFLYKNYSKYENKDRLFKLQYTDNKIKRADLVVLSKNKDIFDVEIIVEFKVWHVYKLDDTKMKKYIGEEKIGPDYLKYKDHGNKALKIFVLVCIDSFGKKLDEPVRPVIASYPGLDELFKYKKEPLKYENVKEMLKSVFKTPFYLKIKKKGIIINEGYINLLMEEFKEENPTIELSPYLCVNNELYCFIFKENEEENLISP